MPMMTAVRATARVWTARCWERVFSVPTMRLSVWWICWVRSLSSSPEADPRASAGEIFGDIDHVVDVVLQVAAQLFGRTVSSPQLNRIVGDELLELRQRARQLTAL